MGAIDSSTAARALLAERKVLPLTRVPRHESLVDLIAGEPVKGSWWSHPAGKKIYAIAEELGEMPGVLTAKLLAGKVTFVDASLWPALLRVATDPAHAPEDLSAAAQAILRAVRAADVRLDAPPPAIARLDRKAISKAREELETRLLVAATQVHTERGAHTTLYRDWTRWASPEVAGAARALRLEEARAALTRAARGAPLPMLDLG